MTLEDIVEEYQQHQDERILERIFKILYRDLKYLMYSKFKGNPLVDEAIDVFFSNDFMKSVIVYDPKINGSYLHYVANIASKKLFTIYNKHKHEILSGNMDRTMEGRLDDHDVIPNRVRKAVKKVFADMVLNLPPDEQHLILIRYIISPQMDLKSMAELLEMDYSYMLVVHCRAIKKLQVKITALMSSYNLRPEDFNTFFKRDTLRLKKKDINIISSELTKAILEDNLIQKLSVEEIAEKRNMDFAVVQEELRNGLFELISNKQIFFRKLK